MTSQILKCALALFIISPLINVGPVNVSALLLLVASGLKLSNEPQQFIMFWQKYRVFMGIMAALTGAFTLSNFLSNHLNTLGATFSQARWFLLITVAAPAVVHGLKPKDWRDIGYFSTTLILLFTVIYLSDAIIFLSLDSNLILDLIDAQRGDPHRPAWVFNPHPFSRTLIAAMLLLLGGALVSSSPIFRAIYLIGIIGLGVLLILGAVRTAFIAVAVIGCLSAFFYAGRRIALSLSAGLVLSAVGLWFRHQLFPMAQSDQSLELREALFEQGVQAFLSNPWFGGGYQAARSIRWPPELQQFADAQTMATTNTHLQWLEMLVSYGVLGGLLFTAMWLLSGWLVLQASTQSSGVQRLAGVLLFFNWMSLTIASFTTVYRESEWALWIMTLLAAFSLLQHKPKASASKHADIVTG